MMRKNIVNFLTISIYLMLGIVLGFIIDKDWLNNEQIRYVQKLEAENEQLVQAKQAWVRYVEDEFNQIKFYTTAENDEQFQSLNQVLTSIGVTLEKLPETMGVYQQQGIIISIGEELEETYGLPHLKLQAIPSQEVEFNLMYLSLLRMKEELLQ
ncbi:hypothetical protein H1D32_13785 [Anaerobacillus sp. CMMVII]|uniref:hypothetical protein n=1 Tax=Anaerobacillus sp. CMMVII TaxID=2755588 RepID=UPI0021B75F08|nr:hypothetical protein [Anaerobacillus sp. CMMVII]MCT8138715.1 hypothetical protein [Anaerobacillus sp. CMMVII]